MSYIKISRDISPVQEYISAANFMIRCRDHNIAYVPILCHISPLSQHFRVADFMWYYQDRVISYFQNSWDLSPITHYIFIFFSSCLVVFLASQDALEVMRVTHSLTHWVIVSIDFTDVTLVSDDTCRRLYWCDPDHSDDPGERYLVMKVIQWWKLSSDRN